jgi:hypothetical protein
MLGVGGHLDRYPKHRGTEVIRGGAPIPSLRGIGLCLSVAPGLDGVLDGMVIANLVAHGGTTRRKVAPSLLPRLGALGPRLVEAIAKGVTTAPRCLLDVSVGEPPVSGGHCLGRPGERGTVPRG